MSVNKILFWVTLYAVAMGFLESSVVIYLRELIYPHGFSFPLVPLHRELAAVELWREAGTIIMLIAVGILAGRNRSEKFAWFLYSFAVWDIFYYVFLYVFLAWPQSLFTWDILFLIPVPWVGPVIAPCIVAATMILFALTTVYRSARGRAAGLKRAERLALLAGALVCIGAFIEDYVVQNKSVLYNKLNHGGAFLSEMAHYVPQHFDWITFSIGEALLLLAYGLYTRRLMPQCDRM